MSHRTRQRGRAMIAAFLVVTLATAFVACYLFVERGNGEARHAQEIAMQTTTAPPVSDGKALRVPDANVALRELYGVEGAGGQAKLGAGKVAKVVVAKPFVDGGQTLFAVVTQLENIEEPGKPLMRRFGHGAQVGAVVYRLGDGHWNVAAKEPNIAEFGAPEQIGGGWEPDDTDLIRIGPERRALWLCTTYDYHGTTGETGRIFEIAGTRIIDRGQLVMGEENSAACLDGLAGRLLGRASCYGYRGELEYVGGRDSDYYDILLRRKGSTYASGEPHGAAPASSLQVVDATDVVYRYDGRQYVSANAEK